MNYSSKSVGERLSNTASLYRQALVNAEQYPENIALVFYSSPNQEEPSVQLNYLDLFKTVTAITNGLTRLDLKDDDCVAILLPAVPESISTFIAASEVCVAFPVNLLLSAEALASQLKLANVKLAITLEKNDILDIGERLREAISISGMAIDIVEVPFNNGKPKVSNTAISWQEFTLDTNTVYKERNNSETRIAALFHTGGTTGEPKLARLSSRNLSAGALMSAGAMKWKRSDRNIVCLPMFHVGGNITSTMSTLSSGATVVFPSILGARDPSLIENIWSFIEKAQATILIMVPTSLSSIYDVDLGKNNLSKLRGIMTGSTPISPDLATAIETKTKVPVSRVYGMTETSGVCTTQPCDETFRSPNVGHAAPLLELKIEISNEAQKGEVIVKGPNCFCGYLTSKGIIDNPNNGWLKTGDVGYLKDGQLKLVGRSKDTIIRGGHNIDPLVIEEVAQSHPSILQAAAVAIPDEYAGELPCLFVSSRENKTVSLDELSAFMSARISEPPARPKRIIFLDALPLTPVGKIARFRLRQKAALIYSEEQLLEHPISELSCDDISAKEIQIQFEATASDEQINDAEKRIRMAGLLPKSTRLIEDR